MSYNQNPYEGMDRAEIGEGGGKYISKLGVGRFSFRIIRALMKPTRRSGDQTIVELELIESSNPNEPLGQKVSWFQPHSNRDMLLKNLKTFAAAALGYHYPDDKDRIERELSPRVVDLWVRATSPENILCGKCITADNSEYTTRDTKEERIIPYWSPFEGEEPPARVEAGASSAVPVPPNWPAHVPIPAGMTPPQPRAAAPAPHPNYAQPGPVPGYPPPRAARPPVPELINGQWMILNPATGQYQVIR